MNFNELYRNNSTRGRAARQLVGLITRRSPVQIRPPQPKHPLPMGVDVLFRLTRGFVIKFGGMKKLGELSRRDVLKGVLGTGIVVGAGYLVSTELLDDGEEVDKDPEPVDGTKFVDGTIYNPAHVDTKLSEWYKSHVGKPLFEHLTFETTKKEYAAQVDRLNKQHRRNFTKEGVPALMREWEKDGLITCYEAEENLKDSSLTLVEEMNSQWRCRGIGAGASTTPKNNPEYLRLMPGAATVLKDIGRLFQEKIKKSGLASEWQVRFVVNSLVRTSGKTNQELANASDDSPHTFGLGFDISNVRFDLIHVADKTFTMIGRGDGSTNKARDAAILTTLNHLLIQVLEAQHAAGKLVLTYEPRRVHYHLTSKQP